MLCFIVLMSPEVATTPPWRNLFSTSYYREHLVVVAVDEAHCIHEWLEGYMKRAIFILMNVIFPILY